MPIDAVRLATYNAFSATFAPIVAANVPVETTVSWNKLSEVIASGTITLSGSSIDLSGYTLTSSFDPFTGSMNAFSSSITNQVNGLNSTFSGSVKLIGDSRYIFTGSAVQQKIDSPLVLSASNLLVNEKISSYGKHLILSSSIGSQITISGSGYCSGQFGVGLIPTAKFHVYNTDARSTETILFSSDITGTGNSHTFAVQTANATHTPRGIIGLQNMRGTLASPSTLLQGDRCGEIIFGGHFGSPSAYVNPASIYALVETGSISSTSAPMSLVFQTTPEGSATRVERLRIAASGNVGIGASVPKAVLHVADQNNACFRLEEFNDYDGVNIRCYSARGTIASPTALINGSRLLSLSGFGRFDTSVNWSAVSSQINMIAAQDWSSGKCGSYIVFSTTPIDSATLTSRMTLHNDGGLVVGSPTGGSKGAGTINAQAVYDDNVLLSDYVFDVEYKKSKIEEVKQYIDLKGKLPWIHETPENIKDISLGKRTNHLLETVENLTLMIIELDEKVTILESEIQTLKDSKKE